MEELSVLSLFCGVGGLDHGFHINPLFRVMKSIDNMKHAIDTYELNFPGVATVHDVTSLLDDEYDLGFQPDVIIGGPPCQEFSVAGKQKIGARANMTLVYVDIICKYKPRYFVMENVPTIQSIGKVIFDAAIERLQDAGYDIAKRLVYMPDYGVPQLRKRLIVMGVRGGVADELARTLDTKKAPVSSMRDYMMRKGVDLGLEGKDHVYRHPRNYSRRGVFSVDELYPTVRGVLRKMPPNYTFHEGDTCHERESIINPNCNFVARIQTFPENFVWLPKNNSIIIGNAVPPVFSKVMADVIANHYTAHA